MKEEAEGVQLTREIHQLVYEFACKYGFYPNTLLITCDKLAEVIAYCDVKCLAVSPETVVKQVMGLDVMPLLGQKNTVKVALI